MRLIMGDNTHSLKGPPSRIITSSMNKRHLHHVWRTFRLIKPWYFLVLAVIFGLIAVVALRANNQHMAQLRQAVYTADKENGDVQGTLNDLQAYVTAHMNTSLTTGNTAVYPPIQLQYTYQRLVQAQSAAQQSANSDLYTQAQNYCQALNSKDFSGRNRVPCIEQYVTSHSTVKLAPIPDDLYKFSFASPKWSPDFAGWSLVVAVLSWIVAGAVLVGRLWLKLSLK